MKPRLKIKQTASALGGDYTIWNVFNTDSKWFHGFTIDSDMFKKTPTIGARVQHLMDLDCHFTADKMLSILEKSQVES